MPPHKVQFNDQHWHIIEFHTRADAVRYCETYESVCNSIEEAARTLEIEPDLDGCSRSTAAQSKSQPPRVSQM